MGSSGIVLAIVLIGSLSAISISIEEENKLESVTGIGVSGVDLWTTSSCVGVYMNGHIEIIPNDKGNRTTPSWVAFTDSESLIEVQRDIKRVPYKIANKDGKPYIQVQIKDGETKVFSPEETSAMILTKMKETAEAFLGKKITDAVVPVPTYFSDAQRKATRDACMIAGLNVVTIINEPTAAAFAYNLHEDHAERSILVFYLDDGTFDVSVLTVEQGIYELHATTHLEGEDFNQRIVEYFIKLIKDKYGKDITKDNRALVKLRMEAERTKRALSSQHQVPVEINSLFDGVNFSEPLTRARFEELNNDLFRKTMVHVKKTMEDAGLEKHQIDEVILVGGTTKIPKVQQLLRDYFDGKELKKSVNPDEVVAVGAAVVGNNLEGEEQDRIC